MIRRTFIKAFGGAILGTVIALKLPESIAPLNNLFYKRSRITFAILMEAYNKCKNETNKNPMMILLSPKVYEEAIENMSLVRRFSYTENPIFGTKREIETVKFMSANLVPNGFGQDENEIKIITDGTTYGNMGGRYYFV